MDRALVGSMFLSGPEEHLWGLALLDQSHKSPRGICNSTILSPHLFEPFSVSPVGAGLFPLYLCMFPGLCLELFPSIFVSVSANSTWP